MEEAVNIILSMEEFLPLDNFFSDSANPKYSRISYAIAQKENWIVSKVLERIHDETGACVMYQFDGFIVETNTADER